MTKQEAIKKTVAQYRTVFSSAPGREILFDMMKSNNVLGSTFVQGDPCGTAFKEGERNAILKILTILKINPDDLMSMIEQQEETHV